MGIVAATPVEVTAKAPSETVAPEKSAADLVPGVDYPVIEITDDMIPAEIRKARIANAKAKSAAVKALKTARPQVAQPVATPTQAPVKEATVTAQESTTAAPAVISSGGTPVAGVDYAVIELTDDMTPEDKRKARISNAKAKSAAMKQFKASGGSATATPAEPVAEVAAQTETVVEPAAVESAPPSDIPQPEYIEITEGMAPDEIRQARIQNAKAKSAYNRALKAAGIDPSTMS